MAVQSVQELVKESHAALEAAKYGIARAAPIAVNRLTELIENPETPPHVVSRASEVLLRAAGLDKVTVDMSVEVIDKDSRVRAAAEALAAELDRLAATQSTELEGDIVDAELVDP